MDLLRLETSGWFLVGVLAIVELIGLAILVIFGKLRCGIQIRGVHRRTDEGVSSRDTAARVVQEIERLCSGENPNEFLFKDMSAEEHALFDVTIIDSLNEPSHVDPHRLRSALIRHGYDEQCARRIMSENFSDRLRASTLLSLLHPQWRDTCMECKDRPREKTQRSPAC